MKKYLSLFLIALMFCAIVSVGCGGGGNSADTEQTENLNQDTGGEETGEYDPNEEGRGRGLTGTVHISTTSNWVIKSYSVYGQLRSGRWVALKHEAGSVNSWGSIKAPKDRTTTISQDYKAYGFEVDVLEGTDWPYSGVFWEADKDGKFDKIDIELGGTSYNANVKITVDGKVVVDETNCSEHLRYQWNDWEGIRVEIKPGGVYEWKSAGLYMKYEDIMHRKYWTHLVTYSSKTSHSWWNDVRRDEEYAADKLSRTKVFYVPDSLASDALAFGFEFDVLGGTDWPYSGVFWKASDHPNETVKSIVIETGGTTLNASIKIYVNNKEVVNNSDCSRGPQYYWKNSDKIRIKTYKTGAYRLNAQRIYARKSSGSKWDIVLDETNGDHEKLIDDDYIEFGFEFDVDEGRDWPYSRPFWTASDSAKTSVDDIYIEMTGTWIWNVNLDIYVNNERIYHNTNLKSGPQYFWKTWEGTRIRTYKTTSYRLNAQRVYASNPGQGWTCVLDETNGDHTTYVSGYTEFGFEFDIEWGTDWPFSRPFWYGSAPDDIYIEMTGGIRTADLKIEVDGNTIYDNTNLSSGSRYGW